MSAPSFYVTGGTLRHDAPSYVERQADRDLFDGLLAGEFCYVLTPRQMGKSSLMVRTASKLREQGVNVLALDLTAIGQNLTPEQWYDGLVARMGRQLSLDEDLDRYWRIHERLGPCQRFFAAIRDVVLRRRPGALAIFVDEIDAVRSLPFSTDEFFAAIRECYNRRAEDAELTRVTFCLLGVATPSDLIRDMRTTPFNIGRRIELHDFTRAEAAALAQGLNRLPRVGNGGSAGSDLPEAMAALTAERLLTRILFWTGGHPYLTQRFCRTVADDAKVADRAEVDGVCAELFLSTQARERDDNLLFVRERLLRSDTDLASLLELYRRVLRGKTVLADETSELVNVLRLSGIVKAPDGRLRERNRIYARAFDKDWIKAHMPDAELRRQREAFRRGVVRTTAISVVVIAILTVNVLIAVDKATKASKALAQSYVSQAKTERTSGRSGQRVDSLRALGKARPYYANEMELRNGAIASFALVDLEKSSIVASLPPGTTAVAIAPMLTHHALGDAQGAIRLIETESDRLAAELPAIGIPTTWLAVSANGRFVAAHYGGADPHRLTVWDVNSGAAVLNFSNQVSPVALDFSSDSSKVAVGFPTGQVSIFTLPEGKTSVSLPLRLSIEEARVPLCVRFDPSGSRLAESSRASQVVQIWNLTQQTSNSLFHPSPIVAMAWSPDGHSLATASENHDLYLWDLRFPDKKREFSQAHSGAIIDLAFNAQGDLLASLGVDMTLKLWVTATGRQMTHPLEGEPSGRLHFSKEGRRLGYAGVKSGLQVWNVIGPDHYRVFRALGEANAPFTSLCFNPEGRVVVAANELGAFFWDAAAGRELSFLPTRAATFALVHSVRGDLLASTPFGFYRWRQQKVQEGNSIILKFGASECFDLPSRLGRCAWGPAEAQAAVVHEDHIHLVNTEGPSTALKLPFKGAFDGLMTSPDGKWLVTWTEDPNRLIEVWDLPGHRADAKPVQAIPGLRHFAFSPDGKFFVTCSARQYQLWDTETWQHQKLALTPSSSGESHCVVAFAPAGRKGESLLALANAPTTLKLFRVSHGLPAPLLELATLESPDHKPLLALAFNAEGSRLAAAAADQTVQVWNLAKIREELVRMKLEGDLPVFDAKSEGPLTVVLKPDRLDTEKPQLWQEVEVLTAALAGAPDPKGGDLSKNLVRRGKCYLDLRRPREAGRDFEAALRLDPDDADLQELLRKATALTDKTTLDPEEKQDSSGQAGKD